MGKYFISLIITLESYIQSHFIRKLRLLMYKTQWR